LSRLSTALSLAAATALSAALVLAPVLGRSKHRSTRQATPVAVVIKVAPTAADAAGPEPPREAWSDGEVIAALRQCVVLLAPIAAEVEISPPLREQECGAPAPVVLHRLGSGDNRVELTPPALVNCPMVAHLHRWLERTLQPAAREMLGSPITRLRNTSGYACRKRNGSVAQAEVLSEHAKANAIDIAGFETADGRRIDVAQAWGATERDSERKDKARTATQDHAQPSESAVKAKAPSGAAAATPPARSRRSAHAIETAQVPRLGRAVADAGPGEPATASPEQAFLRRLHKEACAMFGTVLGPEANEAHRDHLHFDLLARKRSAYCH
jgi:hypothetical protein